LDFPREVQLHSLFPLLSWLCHVILPAHSVGPEMEAAVSSVMYQII
jgi:hypothetical protein